LFARATLLGKYEVAYYRCHHCGFVETEEPYWFDDAYAAAITESDIGMVSRSVGLATVSRAVIGAFFNPKDRFVDYGGGYGLFVRIMRDAGFDFYWTDKYCSGIFARGFEAALEKDKGYETLTAFEVFEHLADPVSGMEEMLRYSDNILFSTMLIPSHAPKPEEWWYYGLEHGQHVSFYTHQSLALMAKRFGLNLCSNNSFIHLFTKKKIPAVLFKLLTTDRAARAFNLLRRRKTYLFKDFEEVVHKMAR
jgi:hypothetical protein